MTNLAYIAALTIRGSDNKEHTFYLGGGNVSAGRIQEAIGHQTAQGALRSATQYVIRNGHLQVVKVAVTTVDEDAVSKY